MYSLDSFDYRRPIMAKKPDQATLAATLGTTFAVTLAATAPAVSAADNPFGIKQFQSGYMVAADEAQAGDDKAAEGKCGSEKAGEGKCGAGKGAEGKCGS
jgi:uncharacterized low-complexity protein